MSSYSDPKGRPHVAIIGGGLCGLALAIALTKRKVPYTIYETRSSFTEIGAGINLGPNLLEAFNLIDPPLGDVMLKLATRNPPGRENVWLSVRLGAPTEEFEDARLVMDIQAPPTGNMTVSRNELLSEMSKRIDANSAQFNKKLVGLENTGSGVTLQFEDGSQEHASLVVACDGAHSATRRLILGPEDPAAYAQYSDMGVYRAVFSMDQLEHAIGHDVAHCSHVWSGPGGYIIQYPINGGREVNVGFWIWKRGKWERKSWVLDEQKAQLIDDFGSWGPTIRNTVGLTSDQIQFWAAHHHSIKPKSYFKGRSIIIGDAAHSMGPHKGQGAAQSMEDAYVMAQVLQDLTEDSTDARRPESSRIEAAFSGYEAVRRARFERVLDTSYEAMSFWSDFWRPDLAQLDLERFSTGAYERMRWIWDARLQEQGQQARDVAREKLGDAVTDPNGYVQ